MMHLTALFASPVIIINKVLFDSEIVLEYLQKQEYQDKPIIESQPLTTNRKNLFKFNKDFDQSIKKGLDQLQYNIGYKIVSAWGTKTPPKGFSHFHTHANSWMTGVYYPHGNFKIELEKSVYDHWDIPVKKYNVLNSQSWTFDVEENMFIMFSANLRHRIVYNESKIDRYSLAMNIRPKGIIGNIECKIKV